MISIALLLSTLLGSFILLLWSADRLVSTALSIAQRWRISPALVGMTVLAIGTSFPELMISAVAAAQGSVNMAVANLQGSNIANLGLVLGCVLCVAPLPLKGRFDIILPMILLLSAAVFGGFIADLKLARIEGIILLVASIGWVFWLARRARSDRHETPSTSLLSSPWPLLLLMILLLGLVLVSARALVWSASGLAPWLGMSERMIGLSVLAVGSSLPELVTTLAAARRAEHSLVLGNIAGSNIINLLLGGALVALIGPGQLTAATRAPDLLVLIGFTIGVIALWWWHRQRSLRRGWGWLLLACYTLYIVMNYGKLF